MLETLSNPMLWTGLYPSSDDPESFGTGQPLVRSSTWRLLHALLQNWKGSLALRLLYSFKFYTMFSSGDIQTLLTTLSVAVLRSAFVEPDVQVRAALLAPWLTFLKEFPNAWGIEASYRDDDEDDESEEEYPNGDETKIAPPGRPTAFQAFLQFLELGCGGAPVQGYPTVIIILSTIPSSVSMKGLFLPMSSRGVLDHCSSRHRRALALSWTRVFHLFLGRHRWTRAHVNT
jgi:hypothetical protein